MSHLSTIEVNIDNLMAAKKALEEMGYSYKDGPITMRTGFGHTANVELQVCSKDGKLLPIGLQKNKDGTLEIVADWWGTGINKEEFSQHLQAYHAKYKLIDLGTQNRYKVEESKWVQKDGKKLLMVTLGAWHDPSKPSSFHSQF